MVADVRQQVPVLLVIVLVQDMVELFVINLSSQVRNVSIEMIIHKEYSHSIMVDPCVSTPCQNNGQCSWDGTTMTCTCVNGYLGALCQIPPSNI